MSGHLERRGLRETESGPQGFLGGLYLVVHSAGGMQWLRLLLLSHEQDLVCQRYLT